MRKKEVSYSKKTIVRLIWTGILVAGVIILTMGAVCFAGSVTVLTPSQEVHLSVLLPFDVQVA